MPRGKKLRAKPLETPLRVVLVEPEIPPNTGSVARTCAATGSALHLVGKLGFRIDEHSVRRAGLDYWPLVDLHRHETLDELATEQPQARWHLLASAGEKSIFDAPIRPGDALIFGKESVGLDDALLEAHRDRVYGIPTLGPVRSLNLSNAVAITVYAALAKIGALDETFLADDAIGSD